MPFFAFGLFPIFFLNNSDCRLFFMSVLSYLIIQI